MNSLFTLRNICTSVKELSTLNRVECYMREDIRDRMNILNNICLRMFVYWLRDGYFVLLSLLFRIELKLKRSLILLPVITNILISQWILNEWIHFCHANIHFSAFLSIIIGGNWWLAINGIEMLLISVYFFCLFSIALMTFQMTVCPQIVSMHAT